MRLCCRALAIAVALAAAGEQPAQAAFAGPPAIPVYADDFPLDVAFFFPAGGPLERFTGRPGAWYALYRMALDPGRPYDLVLIHRGDPGRMRVYALDNHPFDRVSVKAELGMQKAEGWRDREGTPYVATIALPRDAAVREIYLLLEWSPPPGRDRPLPVSLQLLSMETQSWAGQERSWERRWGTSVKSPLQSRIRGPYEIPVPRRSARERDAGSEGDRMLERRYP